MENRQKIVQELQDISSLLADMPLVNLYAVPYGYFESLPGIVLDKIRIEALMADASAKTFTVPQGYFERLPSAILSQIKAGENRLTEETAELDQVAPFLNMISRQNVYAVPEGYFDEAAQNEKKEAKVVTLQKARRWMQYAAVAVVAGVLITGAFLFTDSNNYLEHEKFERLDVSSGLNNVSEADLVKYLNNPEHVVPAPATTLLASEEELADVKSNIRQLSDEELNQYLKENAESFDAVASEKEN
jgi:hypothetical protein